MSDPEPRPDNWKPYQPQHPENELDFSSSLAATRWLMDHGVPRKDVWRFMRAVERMYAVGDNAA